VLGQCATHEAGRREAVVRKQVRLCANQLSSHLLNTPISASANPTVLTTVHAAINFSSDVWGRHVQRADAKVRALKLAIGDLRLKNRMRVSAKDPDNGGSNRNMKGELSGAL
jgi:hypothetical protein